MIKAGDKGAQVVALQEKLLALGYVLPKSRRADGALDGIAGNDLATACMAYVIERRLIPVPEMGTGDLKPSALRESIEVLTLPDSLIKHIMAAKPYLRGVDVSENQGHLDFMQLCGAGIKFAWARATTGKAGRDKAFATYWPQMKMAGLARGAYHVFNPNRSGAEQLDNYKAAVKDLGPGDLRPMIDVEGTKPEPNANKALGEVIEVFTKAFGAPPVIYSSKNMYDFWDLTVGGECANWLTGYSVGIAAPRVPVPPWHEWNIWQTGYGGGKGKFAALPGCTVDIDRDLLNGGEVELDALRLR